MLLILSEKFDIIGYIRRNSDALYFIYANGQSEI